MKALGFDIETAKITPREDDVKKHRPLGIACAAIYSIGDDKTDSMTFHGPVLESGMYAGQMSPESVQFMVDYLIKLENDGWSIITHNGLSFDFDITAEECQSKEYAKRCAELAMRHIDIGFQMVTDKGYMSGLDALSKGIGLPGKPEGVHGDLAPEMWARSREDQEKVLKYVIQDCKSTVDFFIKASQMKYAKWISKAGKLNYWQFGSFMSAQECLKKPVPDTSWMSTPRKREDYYSWITSLERD